MKAFIVRFVSLYLFNLVVLLLIGLLLSSVSVGLSALWASLILTLATMWVRPLVRSMLQRKASRTVDRRTKVGESLTQLGIVLLVALVVWVGVVLLSGVGVRGFFWWWVLPPVVLTIAWTIWDAIAERVQARGAALYERAMGGPAVPAMPDDSPQPESPQTREGREELKDGLTEEQRRLLDEL